MEQLASTAVSIYSAFFVAINGLTADGDDGR